ncbi:hypothetical protein BDR03DRAFT_943243 [Suillus americanus]|nr:hypothetical protein BDR03DRAFT_943243 [Suillus americanus]
MYKYRGFSCPAGTPAYRHVTPSSRLPPRLACGLDAAEVLSDVSNSSPIVSRGTLLPELFFELRPLPAQLVSVFSFTKPLPSPLSLESCTTIP